MVAIQKLVDSLRRRNGKNVGMVMKVNLEKEYDRVDWDFLQNVLAISGFSRAIQDLIMHIVMSTSLRVCWNGELLETFS